MLGGEILNFRLSISTLPFQGELSEEVVRRMMVRAHPVDGSSTQSSVALTNYEWKSGRIYPAPILALTRFVRKRLELDRVVL